jgi:predicted  nucleic acid-binding Zn-ribbon protein
MSQQEYYETVQREQEFLETKLEDYLRQKEYLEWQLASVTSDIDKIKGLIENIEKELGNVTNS